MTLIKKPILDNSFYSDLFGVEEKYFGIDRTFIYFFNNESLGKERVKAFLASSEKIGYSYKINGHTGKESDQLDSFDHIVFQKYKWIYINFDHPTLYTPLIKIINSPKVGLIASIYLVYKADYWGQAHKKWVNLAKAFADNFPFRFGLSVTDVSEDSITDISTIEDLFRHPGKGFVNIMAWGNEFLDEKKEKILLGAPAFSVKRLKYGIFMEVFPFIGLRDEDGYHDLPDEYYSKVMEYFHKFSGAQK